MAQFGCTFCSQKLDHTHPQELVLDRAWEIARRIAEKSDSTLRFTRAIMVQPIKKQTLELQGMGLAYESLAGLGRGLKLT